MNRFAYFVLVIVVCCSVGVVSSAGRDGNNRPSYEFYLDANSLVIRAGDEVLLSYRYGAAPPKSYVRELFTPSGLGVLLDSPPDHVHHHGLMFACVVDGVDFWVDFVSHSESSEVVSLGRQEHQRFSSVGADSAGRQVGLVEDLAWVESKQGKTLLKEQRTIRLHRHRGLDATFLTWESRFTVPAGKESAVLTGAHYHGLGLRFIRTMDATGKFRNPDDNPGVVFRGQERLTRSPWCAYTAQVEGKTVTVAMFGHPDNPRHPTTWFTMAEPFAYLSATMRLHDKPLTIVEGKPLKLSYAVALWDRPVKTQEIDRLYERWSK